MATPEELLTQAANEAVAATKIATEWANKPAGWFSATESGPLPSIKEFNQQQAVKFEQAIANTGWFPVAGSFEAGGTITERNQYLALITAVGEQAAGGYSWGGVLPKTVTAGSTPATSGGIGPNAWVYRGDATLRTNLNDGVALIYGELSADVARATKNWDPFYVEKYRGVGFSDSETINAALTAIGAANRSARLIFDAGRVYIFNAEHSIRYINDLLIDLNGATLKRADGSTTSTTTSASFTTAGTTVIPLTSVPANWKVGDYVTAFTSDADADTSRDRRRITAIGASSVTIAGSFSFSPAKTTLTAGTTVAKNFICIAGRPSSTDSGSDLLPGINSRIFIRNGIIDGNAANQLNKSWRFCTEIGLHSKGGIVDLMWFKNTIGECFVGHGVSIINSLYEDIGGSCYHTSVNDESHAISGRAYFLNNTCRRLNKSTQIKNGHSEGAITFSWNPGDFVIAGNQMEQGAEYFLGSFAASTGTNSGEFLQCYGNIVKDFKGIFDTFGAPAFGISITDNVFHDCGDNAAKTRALGVNANCTYSGNTHTGTTIGTNVSVSDLLKVGIGAKDKPLSLQQAFWAGRTLTPAYTNTLDTGVVSILENAGSCFQALISNGLSGSVHYAPGGASAGSAFTAYNPSNLTYTFGTNETGGITEIRAGQYQLKIKAGPNGVELPNFNGLFLGDQNVDGCVRIAVVGTDMIFARRVSGSFVNKHTISLA